MKKIVLITITVLLIGGMTLAVGYGTKAMQRVQDTTCENFVDADGDGINDNCPVDGEKVYMNRKGQAGNEAATRAMQRVQDPTTCENFVDADGDGINDNCPVDGEKVYMNRKGQAGNEAATRAMQRVQDPTTCENFVDADGDGINDNCPNDGVRELKNAQDGTGYRHGASGEKGPGLGRGFGKAAQL
ncbi:hypothetical protein [Mesotoga prima]|mgnify:FL=1|nr:hypothetical protein [Mesotoga prima]CCU84116.1 Thrombospondin type 3 repeat protein [Mesotoga infera]HNQ71933.1 Thrombospondin type 3 repeat protein [Mesotoga prima]